MKNNTLLIAIVAILALVVVKFAFFGGYDARSVEKLMKKSLSQKNYSMNISIKSGANSSIGMNCTLKRKKDIYTYEMGMSGINAKVYMDVANDDVVMTMMNYAFTGHISDLDANYSVEKLDQTSGIMEYLKEENMEFEYLGIEKYDSKDCIHFKLEKNDGSAISDNCYKEEVYLEKSKGSLERLVAYDKNDSVVLDSDFEIEYNVVTDSDVAKPNTSGMKVMNLKDMLK